ncbi:MAG: serine/threonine-protein phosphatase [Nitrospirae bacterium]|nr:serine/threonine-protein phosphatase [Nitrospirota bacterium]
MVKCIVQIKCRTDKGKRRQINQDMILSDSERGLILLADGIGGGHRGGEVASELAVNEAHAYLKDKLDLNPGKPVDPALLSEAVAHAHKIIKEKARCSKECHGMGTTLVILLMQGRMASICHVGDSRAYIIQKEIQQITEDHTFQNYIGQHALIRSLFFHKKTRTLTQAVGISEELCPESVQMEIANGAVLLLCSDGLTDMLSDTEILKIIHDNKFDPDTSADALVAEANKKGGIDNITVALLSLQDNCRNKTK